MRTGARGTGAHICTTPARGVRTVRMERPPDRSARGSSGESLGQKLENPTPHHWAGTRAKTLHLLKHLESSRVPQLFIFATLLLGHGRRAHAVWGHYCVMFGRSGLVKCPRAGQKLGKLKFRGVSAYFNRGPPLWDTPPGGSKMLKFSGFSPNWCLL